jgi:transcriptional regulator with XRE-family HTH domain
MSEIKEQLGEYIRLCRDKHKLSQEELAGRVGLSTHHISKIENGKTSAKFENILKICMELDMSLDYFIYLISDDKRKQYANYKGILEKTVRDDMKMHLNEAVEKIIDDYDIGEIE